MKPISYFFLPTHLQCQIK